MRGYTGYEGVANKMLTSFDLAIIVAGTDVFACKDSSKIVQVK